MNKIKKEKGYLIYFDVLGYKQILKNKDTKSLEKLKTLLETLSNYSQLKMLTLISDIKEDEFFSFCFSDNFVIGYVTESLNCLTLMRVCGLATLIQGYCIKKGFLIRGSIVYGDIERNKNLIFGTTIVQAYDLENNHNEPSFVLGDNLQKIYEKHNIWKSEILNPFSASQDCPPLDFYDDYIIGIKEMINRLNLEPIIEDKTIKKYQWLINQLNLKFKKHKELDLKIYPSHVELCEKEGAKFN